MDGIRPGSLDTLIAETSLVSFSADGLRFMGNGAGPTRRTPR